LTADINFWYNNYEEITMNIFYLDHDPIISAKAMTNKHVVKMIVESGQLLSTAHHILDGINAIPNIYKPTHRNHPSAIWTRESVGNYLWLRDHLFALLNEYAERYHKQPTDHATHGVAMRLFYPPKNIPQVNTATPIRIAITNKNHIVENDGVKSYRNYYIAEKLSLETDIIRFHKVLDGR
jgi:hypothetical protein